MLKELKIGLLIADNHLRHKISSLLWGNGAIVYPAATQEELSRTATHFTFDILISDVNDSYLMNLN